MKTKFTQGMLVAIAGIVGLAGSARAATMATAPFPGFDLYSGEAYCEIANFSGNTQIVGYTMLGSDGSLLLSAGASLLNGQTFQSAKFDLSKVSPSACTFSVPVKRGMRASLVWMTGLGTNDERVETVSAH